MTTAQGRVSTTSSAGTDFFDDRADPRRDAGGAQRGCLLNQRRELVAEAFHLTQPLVHLAKFLDERRLDTSAAAAPLPRQMQNVVHLVRGGQVPASSG